MNRGRTLFWWTGGLAVLGLSLLVWSVLRAKPAPPPGPPAAVAAKPPALAGAGSGPSSIAGFVRQADGGAALPGARVCVLTAGVGKTRFSELACDLTDALGRFRVGIPSRGGSLVLAAAAEGYLGESWPFGSPSLAYPAEGEQREGLELALRRGAGTEIEGLVRDITGGAVVGAKVVAMSASQAGIAPGLLGFSASDERGAFRMRLLPGELFLVVNASGYVRAERHVVVPGSPVEVVLTPQSMICGRVFQGAADVPAGNAEVTVLQGSESLWAGDSHQASSDGSFCVGGLSPGRYQVVARAPGWQGEASGAVVVGLAGSVKEVSVVMQPGFPVTGQAVLGADEPCGPGWIRLEPLGTDPLQRTLHSDIDATGGVTFLAVPPGRYGVKLACREGSGEGSDEGSRERGWAPVTVVDRPVTGLRWNVAKGATVRGVLVDENDQPIAGAMVAVLIRDELGLTRPAGTAATDAEGRFEVTGLARREHVVELAGCPCVPPAPRTVRTGSRPTVVRLEATRGGEIRGKVVDDAGHSVAGALVGFEGSRAIAPTRARTVADGTFSLRGVPFGTARLWASRDPEVVAALRKGEAEHHSTAVVLEPPGPATVELRLPAATSEIRGQILDRAGKPVDDAFVVAEPSSGPVLKLLGEMRAAGGSVLPPAQATTDAEGRFVLGSLPPRRHDVRAFRRGGGQALASDVEPGRVVRLVIEQMAALSGQVSRPAGSAPDAFRVELSGKSTGRRYIERFFGSGGRFTIKELVPDEYAVVVRAREGVGQGSVKVAARPPPPRIDIVLREQASVVGRVVELGTGRPLAGVRAVAGPAEGGLSLSLEAGSGEGEGISDEEGRFRVIDVAPGPVQLSLIPLHGDGDHGWIRLDLDVPAGGPLDVGELALPPADDADRSGDLGLDTP